MDYELDEYLDTAWLDRVKMEESQYDKYYVQDQKRIKIFFLLTQYGNIVGNQCVTIPLSRPNVVLWEDMYEYVQQYLSKGYVMCDKLKYSYEASPEEIVDGGVPINGGGRWERVDVSSDMYLGNIVEFMHDLTCVVCVMKKNDPRSVSTNSTTRRVYMGVNGNNRSRTRKSRIF